MLKKILKAIKRDGVLVFSSKAVFHVYTRISGRIQSFISLWFTFNGHTHRRRMFLSNELYTSMKGVVGYGPFKGFKLNLDYVWGRADIGAMLFGLYEKEILDIISQKDRVQHKTIINLGAADGYYGIGCLINRLFEKSYCYELTEYGRSNIRHGAEINGIESNLFIKGIASKVFYEELIAEGVDLSDSLLLCDIEGGEFDVFTEDTFRAFKGATILIEIHDWCEGGFEKYKNLKKLGEKYFHSTEIRTGARDLSKFTELESYYDSDRWIICGEGRGKLGKWLLLESVK